MNSLEGTLIVNKELYEEKIYSLANTLKFVLNDLNSEIDYETTTIIVSTLIDTMGSKFVIDNLPNHQPLIDFLTN